jgi:uncharacterized membrane protein YedE/YeeE
VKTERAYANPYLAGVGIGVVLLLSFLLVGRGLGATGAFSSVLETRTSGFAPLGDWLVVEIAGVIIGGFASAFAAGRFRLAVERGPRISDRSRLLAAFAGGAIMGLGAKLARGCTSGLGLTGGALLAVGSWVFVIAAFAGAYALAPMLRRLWR